MDIMLSIKPEFIDKIMTGEKRFEYRRMLPTNPVENVIMYSTYPVSKVVGMFSVKRIISTSPDKLWAITKDKSGISKEYFDRYFKDKLFAHAFEIETVYPYNTPIDVSLFLESGKPPQSFCYINEDKLKELTYEK